jgi:SOS-response transcriptional repressor LexA
MSIGKGIGKNKKGLTPKQAKFLAKIKAFIKANGYSPSYEEINSILEIK